MAAVIMRLRPPPEADESFGSWVQRVAIANGLDLGHFVKAIRERYADAPAGRLFWTYGKKTWFVTPDSIEHTQFVALMAAATGFAEDFLLSLTFGSSDRRYQRCFLTPSGRMRASGPRIRSRQVMAWHADNFCPECLAENFYLRRLWRPTFPCYCLVHQRVLMQTCPRCQRDLDYYGVRRKPRRRRNAGELPCDGCNLDLARLPRMTVHWRHRRCIRFLGGLLEGEVMMDTQRQSEGILSAIHWWMGASLHSCFTLPDRTASPRLYEIPQPRRAYVYQPANFRFGLLESVLNMIPRVGCRWPKLNAHDTACSQRLGENMWRGLLATARSLLAMFPELASEREAKHRLKPSPYNV